MMGYGFCPSPTERRPEGEGSGRRPAGSGGGPRWPQRATVSAHQEEIRFYLGFRPFDATAREALSRFLIEEATRVEHMPALLARAEEFLRDRRILLPALSTVRRLAGEQREQARHQVYATMRACLPSELPPRLDALLQVDAEASFSPVQVLKAPPGMPSPPALSRLTAKLDQIQATGVLTSESWAFMVK
jgi:hypothetical protein